MIYIYDAATAIDAIARDLDPSARGALERELTLLTAGEHDLTPWTDICVVERGDTEQAIAHEAGFSPLVDQLSGARHDEPGFQPAWNWLSKHAGVYRLVFTCGSTHATVMLVPDVGGVLPELRATCRFFLAQGN